MSFKPILEKETDGQTDRQTNKQKDRANAVCEMSRQGFCVFCVHTVCD